MKTKVFLIVAFLFQLGVLSAQEITGNELIEILSNAQQEVEMSRINPGSSNIITRDQILDGLGKISIYDDYICDDDPVEQFWKASRYYEAGKITPRQFEKYSMDYYEVNEYGVGMESKNGTFYHLTPEEIKNLRSLGFKTCEDYIEYIQGKSDWLNSNPGKTENDFLDKALDDLDKETSNW